MEALIFNIHPNIVRNIALTFILWRSNISYPLVTARKIFEDPYLDHAYHQAWTLQPEETYGRKVQWLDEALFQPSVVPSKLYCNC